MSIEQTLNEIAANGKRTVELLEALVSGGKPVTEKKAKAEKPAEPKPAPAPAPAKEPEVDPLADEPEAAPIVLNKDRVRGALVAYQTKNGKDKTIALLTKYNAKSIGTLAESTFPTIHGEIVTDLGEKSEELIQAAIAAAKK